MTREGSGYLEAMPTSVRRPCLMFVIGMTPTKIGGMEKFLRALAVRLDAEGWDSVLCLDGEISAEFREYFDLPCLTFESVRQQQDLGLGARAELWTVLRRHKPEIFVYAFHGVMRVFPWMARLAGCRRIFFNDHSSRAPGMVARPLSLHKRLIGRFLTAPLTGIVSVSEFTKRTGSAFGLTTAPNTVVLNGTELKEPSRERGVQFRERYRISQDALVITQVCWMVEVKGVDVMLRAAQVLLQRHAGLRFLLIGGGDKLEEYRAMAQERGIDGSVLFPGVISDPVGAGVFDASDIYCQAFAVAGSLRFGGAGSDVVVCSRGGERYRWGCRRTC